jgi:hypothetical protein
MNKFGLIMAILPVVVYIAGAWYSHQRNKKDV